MMFGGYGRGWRHRRTYCSTGIPGHGRGRCARGYPAQVPPDVARPVPRAGLWPEYGPGAPELSREEELRMLEEEELMLKQDLEDLTKAIADLSENEKKEVNK